jgi:hypothetical protein
MPDFVAVVVEHIEFCNRRGENRIAIYIIFLFVGVHDKFPEIILDVKQVGAVEFGKIHLGIKVAVDIFKIKIFTAKSHNRTSVILFG